LLYLDFLIQESRLIISPDKLCAQNISLCDNKLILILAILPLIFRLLDGVMKFGYLIETVLNFLPPLIHFLFPLLELPTVLEQGLILLLMLEMLLGQGYLLGLYLLLELINLMIDYLIASLELSNLIFSLGQALAVGIPIRPDILIELLLVFEPRLGLYVLLLILRDEVPLELDFLQGLEVLGVGKCRLLAVTLLLLLDLLRLSLEGLDRVVALCYLLLVGKDLFLALDKALVVLLELGLETQQLFLQASSLSVQGLYLVFVLVV